MTSVIIAAHQEEGVIGECLDALAAQQPAQPQSVVVSANACSDGTAAVARERGAVVVERAEAGKAAALNAGERFAAGFPRVYLDADIRLPPHALAAVEAAFDADPKVLAVAPDRRVETAGRPWPVRAYTAVNRRLPAFRDGLFGRGAIALSAAGRARFESFPDALADDLFLDGLFSADERAVLEGVVVHVEAPRTSRALLRRLVRVRRGNAQLRATQPAAGIRLRPSDRWAWWRDVVLVEPRLLPAAVPYIVFTVLAAVLARRRGGGWGQDRSTRPERSPR